MKTKHSLFLITTAIILCMNGCKKDSSSGSTTTPPPPPATIIVPTVSTTGSLSNIATSTTSNYGGSVSLDGGATVTARGVCWSTASTPTTADSKTTDGTGTGSFTSLITGLLPNTTYYVRAYATNSAGTGYGTASSFTTFPPVPTVTTTVISNITPSGASSGGTVTSDGGVPILFRGVCWSTSPLPVFANDKTTNGTGTGSFTSLISGLFANTTYYVRAYATSSAGTGYGNVISFTTQPQPTVTDIDGNIYHTVIIGTQVWMVENLKTTKYRNGDPIPNVANTTSWKTLTTGAYCDYNNDPNMAVTYGRLYNSYTLSDARNIAPVGWHVPTSAEWTTLTSYISPADGDASAGGDLKEKGTVHWQSPNDKASNSVGFTALPGGYRNAGNGIWEDIRLYGYWWTSSPFDANNTYCRVMSWIGGDVAKGGYSRNGGMSIRCVKN